jgi:electron transfer flavoprotein alpha subunit
LLADLEGVQVGVLWLVPPSEEAQRLAVAQLRALSRNDVTLLPAAEASASAEVRSRLLADIWPSATTQLKGVVSEPWAELAFAALAGRATPADVVALRVRRFAYEADQIVLDTAQARGKLLARQTLLSGEPQTRWVTLLADAEIVDNRSAILGRLKPFTAGALQEGRVERWSPRLERFYGRREIVRLLEEVKSAVGVAHLGDAEFIIDVGYGIGNRDGYEEVIEPLEKALLGLGVRSLVIGGSRKVTEELHLLPADRQIGQSGVSVAPRLLLAIGISGAPQHLNYIGSRTVIVAFNRDPEAPLMTLFRRQPRPRVFPVVGDLFETVPALTTALRQQRSEGSEQPTEAAAGS